MSKEMKLSPPWVKYFKELKALFEFDPHVSVTFDEDEYVIKVYVEGAVKAEALTEILPMEKEFGNVVVKIEVIPANLSADNPAELFKAAFEGNPVFAYAISPVGVFNAFKYIVFKPEVVQFYNDDLGDVNGNCTTLYQDIAKDVFKDFNGVYFCTDEVN